MWRSLLAVLAGWAAIQALVLATDAVLVRLFPRQYGAGVIPPDWLTALTLGAGLAWSAAGGWLTARLAPERPWRHALYLIVWGETLGAVYTVTTLSQIQWWYPAGLLALFPAAVAAGAWLRVGRLSDKAGGAS